MSIACSADSWLPLVLAGLLALLASGCHVTPPADPSTPSSDRNPEGQVEGDFEATLGTDVVSPRFLNGAVAADSAVASDAGVEILKAGGNAVDAAIATAFTLCVTRPYSCGLGGGGFMIVFDPSTGEATALDFRETCPAAIGPDTYVDLPSTASGFDPSMYGGLAAAIPGEVPGLVAAHERWGSLPLATLVGPAVRAARDGFTVDADHLRAVDRVRQRREQHPDLRPASNWVWANLCGSGRLAVGDILRQPELAAFLERIGDEGLAAWNDAADLVAGVDRAYDGRLAATDLRDYDVVWRRPIVHSDAFHGVDAILMPPPSSGGIAIAQVLQMVDGREEPFGDPAPGEPAHAELLVGALRHAFADRARHLADPDFADVPMASLLDPSRIAAAADRLVPGETVPHDLCGTLPEAHGADTLDDAGTSHFSVIDASGMTVACTHTINGYFGSFVAVPEIGVVLNNEMNDFTTVPGERNMFGLAQSERNLPEPGKRPLSSMSPTIIVEDGRTVMTAGASGGPRIITGTIQTILHVLDGGDDATTAVRRPRLHDQWLPEIVRVEPGLSGIFDRLREVGYDVEETDGVGVVQAIVVHPDGYEPASDPRKGGEPAGW